MAATGVTKHRLRIPKISADCRHALVVAIKRGDPISELEYLGIDAGLLSRLESRRIYTMAQLLEMQPGELMELPNISITFTQAILDAVGRYHELDEEKQDWDW